MTTLFLCLLRTLYMRVRVDRSFPLPQMVAPGHMYEVDTPHTQYFHISSWASWPQRAVGLKARAVSTAHGACMQWLSRYAALIDRRPHSEAVTVTGAHVRDTCSLQLWYREQRLCTCRWRRIWGYDGRMRGFCDYCR